MTSLPRLTSVSLARSAGRAEFRLQPATEAVGQTLRAMGFEPSGGALVRRVPDTPDLTGIFGRFTAHIDEMILCSPLDVQLAVAQARGLSEQADRIIRFRLERRR